MFLADVENNLRKTIFVHNGERGRMSLDSFRIFFLNLKRDKTAVL